ncbi:MAG: shikimate kinase AroK [Gammaproteobacteria bacterium]
MSAQRNIYLIGPMGSGKTAVGRQLALRTGREFIDSDHEIERRTGVDIPYIFEKEGESGFREREREVIATLTQRRCLVVATGGGAVLDERNRDCLSATGIVIHLDTTVEEQLRRTRRSSNRPLLQTDDPKSVLEGLREQRNPLYEAIADYTFDTTGKRVRAVAATVVRALERDGHLALHS